MNTNALLTYGAPFVGAVLLAMGIGTALLGGYVPVQESVGLCGDPTISVSTPGDTERLSQGYETGGGPELSRLAYNSLSAAEQRAVRDALGAFNREAHVVGSFPHRETFERGVVVEYQGAEYYSTLVSENECVETSPLLLPLGLAAIVLGVVGVLTPPLYRRYVAFERRQERS